MENIQERLLGVLKEVKELFAVNPEDQEYISSLNVTIDEILDELRATGDEVATNFIPVFLFAKKLAALALKSTVV